MLKEAFEEQADFLWSPFDIVDRWVRDGGKSLGDGGKSPADGRKSLADGAKSNAATVAERR